MISVTFIFGSYISLCCTHKVLTYVEYRNVSGVFQNIDPHPPLHPASVSFPRTKGGGTHSPGGEGRGGSIFWKTPDIGLACYSIISLRLYLSVENVLLSPGGVCDPAQPGLAHRSGIGGAAAVLRRYAA